MRDTSLVQSPLALLALVMRGAALAIVPLHAVFVGLAPETVLWDASRIPAGRRPRYPHWPCRGPAAGEKTRL